jgi:hypothetical protein
MILRQNPIGVSVFFPLLVRFRAGSYARLVQPWFAMVGLQADESN